MARHCLNQHKHHPCGAYTTPLLLASHSYRGGRSKADFLTFINQKLQEDKGHARVEVLDALVTKFLEDKADKKKVLKEAEAAVNKLGDDVKANGELYVKFMKKAVEKVGMLFC